LRQDLLEAALKYYGEFLAQRGDDPTLKVDAATAHERVGDILIELGRAGDALGAYEHAMALIEPLYRDQPGDLKTATAEVRLHAGRLGALRELGSNPEAIIAFDRARSLGESLLAAGRGTADLPEILTRTYLDAARVFEVTSHADEAVQASLRAHEFARQSTHDYPGDLSSSRTRLVAAALANEYLFFYGRLGEALRLCEQEIAFGKDQVREHPHDVEFRTQLARLEVDLSQLEKYRGNPFKALTMVRDAAATLGALAHDNPLLVRVRAQWGGSVILRSIYESDSGRYAEAEQSARTAIEVYEALTKETQSSSVYRSDLGNGYLCLGKALLGAGSGSEALATLRKAMKIFETSEKATDLHNLACALALASTAADPAEGAAGADRQRGDADRAVGVIRRVVGMRAIIPDALRRDPDLDPLRSREDFRLLMMDVDFPADPFALSD
jgi:serine/threonine-protein kinase